jgi:acyl carrier protein
MTDLERNQVERGVIEILTEMTSDWELGFSGGIGPATSLVADLSFESIEIVQLMVGIEQHFKLGNLASEKLLMKDGQYVPDMTIADIVDFLVSEMELS